MSQNPNVALNDYFGDAAPWLRLWLPFFATDFRFPYIFVSFIIQIIIHCIHLEFYQVSTVLSFFSKAQIDRYSHVL